jgi:hypothetical protein
MLQHIGTMRGLGDSAVDLLVSDAEHWDSGNLTGRIAEAMALPTPGTLPLSEVRVHLRSNLHRGVQTIWLVDHVSAPLAQAFREWTTLCPELAIIAGQARTTRWGLASLEQIDVRPLDLEDSVRMIGHGLTHAAGDTKIFSDSAAVRLHEITQGRIGEMVILAESALKEAARYQLSSVTAAWIDKISDRLTGDVAA